MSNPQSSVNSPLLTDGDSGFGAGYPPPPPTSGAAQPGAYPPPPGYNLPPPDPSSQYVSYSVQGPSDFVPPPLPEYLPPPITSYDESQGYKQYNYDEFNLNYADVQVCQWDMIPADASPYSSCWATQESFEPHNFSENTHKETKMQDWVWVIVFFINLVVTVIVFIALCCMKEKSLVTGVDEDIEADVDMKGDTESEIIPEELSWATPDPRVNNRMAVDCIWVTFLAALIFGIAHFFYMTKLPSIYVKLGVFIAIGFTALFCICAIFVGAWYVLFLAAILGGLGFLIYICCIKVFIPFSIIVLTRVGDIVWKHPFLLLFTFIDLVIEAILSIMYIFMVYLVVMKGMSYFVYVYIIFSFTFTNLTVSYCLYMTISGTASTLYFLEGTDQMPKNPVWESFKRSMTKSFGSACLAAFIVAVVRALKMLAHEAFKRSGNQILQIIACVAMCILHLIEKFLDFINKYGLIYCATFGTPYLEGCRRFTELKVKKFITVLMSGSIIELSLNLNNVIFSAGSAMFSMLIGFALWPYNPTALASFAVAGFFVNYSGFQLIQGPITTVSDTLFICFAEAPKRMKVYCNELYKEFKSNYYKAMVEVVETMKDYIEDDD